MKKKNILLILLGVLVALSSAFAIVASAAEYERAEFEYNYVDSGNVENYDPEEIAKTYVSDVYEWESKKISALPKADGPYYFLPGASVSNKHENLLAFTIFCQGDKMAELYEDTARLQFEIMLLRQGLTENKFFEMVGYTIEYNPLQKK